MYSLPFHSLALAAALLLGTNARTQEKDKPVKDTPKDTFESVIKAQLKVMNDLCDVLETAKDEASGDKAIEKLKPFAKLQQDLGARMTKLGKPGPDEEEALKKKFISDFQKTAQRLTKEIVRLQMDEKLKKVSTAVTKVLEEGRGKPAPKPEEKDKPKDKPTDKP